MVMVDRKKLEALLQWMFQSIGKDLEALVVVDREGLVIASLLKEGLSEDEDLIGGMAALVEPILKRISSEFKSGNFGTGSFDTEKNRLIFCEAGPDAILVVVANALASLDRLFPYAYLCAEKITRIFDGRSVSPVIPDFSHEKEKLQGSKDISQIIIEEGSFILKTVLCGAGGVGKTTLVTQFVQSSFEVDYKSTIGVQIMKKALKFEQWNTEVKFTIFDLAGQAQFMRVRQTYFKGAQAGFLIFDVTRRDTFEGIENWYKEAKDVEPNIMLILVANKIDLENERKVTEEEGKALAEKLEVPYMETSALNKDIVDEAFKTLAFLFVRDHKQMKSLN